ncbi:hypothetical protein [Massilia violaceinigra]|nr:hypothetical protein [Massilia violaceinigra]
MMVDDAAIVEPNHCQLESWVYKRSIGTEYWAVPACNVGGKLEVALGGARIVGGGNNANLAVLQVKTVFKPLDRHGWGGGLVVGTQSLPDHGGIGDVFAAVPLSVSTLSGALLVHTNAGLLRSKATRDLQATWGIGVEAALTERSALTAETSGQQGAKPLVQLGIKHWLVKDRVQLDATYGGHPDNASSGRFVTLGLVLFTNFSR